jgi:hypothetical protein
MNSTLYISVFGLNLNVINDIKSIISNKLSETFTIHWTNIADSKLQVLLINDDFIDLPNINKIRHEALIILRLKKNELKANQIEHDTLFLPLTNTNHFEHWLEHLVALRFRDTNPVNVSNPVVVQDIKPKLNALQISQVFKDLNKHQRQLLLLDQKPIALIDNLSNEFWIEQNIQITQNSEFTLIPADTNTVVTFKYGLESINLQHGLWQFVWDYLDDTPPNYPSHYKLLHWPQPMHCAERQSLLKISAFFMEGSSTQYIAEQIHLSQNIINRYLFACHIAQIIEEIPAMATVYHSQKSSSRIFKSTTEFFP